MKGASAELSVNTISAPSASRMAIIGASQNFFRVFKKSQNSAVIDGFDMFLIYSLRLCTILLCESFINYIRSGWFRATCKLF